MKRILKLLFVAVAAVPLAAVVLGLVIAGASRLQQRAVPPMLELPDEMEILEMRASVKEFQGAYPSLPEFTVPPDYVPMILSWLRPAKVSEHRWTMLGIDEVGEIVIRIKNGDELRLRFFSIGKNPALITPDGTAQYLGRGENDRGDDVDGAMCLRHIIELAFERQSFSGPKK